MRMFRRGRTRHVKIDIYKFDSNFALNVGAAALFCILYLGFGVRNGLVLIVAILSGWVGGYYVRRFLSR